MGELINTLREGKPIFVNIEHFVSHHSIIQTLVVQCMTPRVASYPNGIDPSSRFGFKCTIALLSKKAIEVQVR